MGAPRAVDGTAKLSRPEALAAAEAKLKARRRQVRRKSSLVLSLSVLAFLVPVALFAGLDFSGAFYPAAVGDSPLAKPAPPGTVGPGSAVTLELVGTLDNGSVFVSDPNMTAVIGEGLLVPGLEKSLVGLGANESFDVSVAPADGYGNWSTSRTYHVALTETVKRNTTMEVGNFDDRWGQPQVGLSVPTSPWPSTVVTVGTKYVTLRYEPELNQTARHHKYWDSRVVSINDTSIQLDNLLHVGYTYTRWSDGKLLTYTLTKIDSRGYLFDRNPPLAGQTLHFRGRVVSVEGGLGPGAVGPAAVDFSGRPVSLGPQPCARCHGAFSPIDASATAAGDGAGVRVDLSLRDPWKHEVTAVVVSTQAVEANATVSSAEVAGPNLAAGKSATVALVLPEGPAGDGVVRVVIHATAHHVHRSPGRHDDSNYQLAFELPVGGGGGQAAVVTSGAPATANAGPPTPAELAGLLGQWAGLVAFVAAAMPAAQGLRRHVSLPPWLRFPPWLTAHFAMAAAAVAASLFHAVALMSTTYHGGWTWDVWAGVAGLFALGALGVTGVVLAKWTPARWRGVKRTHYAILTALILAGTLHLIASSTTLRWLAGA